MGRLPSILLAISLFASAWAVSAQVIDSFVVRDIRLEGLQRIAAGTVFNYLPVAVGDTIDASRSAEAIRTLFKTGFFKDVRLEREGDTLVVFLTERPSVSSIDFSGNKDVETEDLLDSLKDVGFAVGRVFNRSTFERVEQELRNLYFSQGKYGVKIESTITPLERNRVGVNFDISEGQVAKIKQINIVGNQVFEEDDLLDEFKLSTTRFLSFFTKSDQYSKQKLAADLESLRSYYLDRGYINFNVESTQVSITPDKKDVFVTVNVTEGQQFTINDIKLAGDLLVDEKELFGLVSVRRGEVFSRKQVTETAGQLTERFGSEGYAFANVNAVPDIDEEKQQVALTFFIDPGKRVYVRRVNFQGNTKTRDEVLRREMRQMEGGWISTSAIERSRERLERLGYFDEINVETPAVPGTADQVDVEFNVVEKPSGNLMAGAGYSQSQGFVFQTSISQDNFLGSGNRVSATFNNSDVNRAFALHYLNPYYTLDGVSRGFDAYYRETDASDANVADYSLDEMGLGVKFGIPINEFDTINVGLLGEMTTFNTSTAPSVEVAAFERTNGDTFGTLVLNGSWARDSRNRRTFPDSGSLTRTSAELAVPGGNLTYYKLNLLHQQFFSVWRGLTLRLEGDLGVGGGYGDTEDLPLVDN
ncbi:MAG: outer membrane protein assembly factor BamA, partial [Gammaproteobacteria bacterium]